MTFDVEVIIDRGKDGRIKWLGAEWTEARAFLEWLMLKLGEGLYWAGCFTALLGIGIAVGFRAPEVGIWAIGGGALLIGVALGVCRLAWRLPGRRNGLMFSASGAIYSIGDERKWKATRGDIMNVEWEEQKRQKNENDMPYTHGVRVILKNGRRIRIGQNLEPDQAAEIASYLAEAIDALDYGFNEAPEAGAAVY